MKVAFCLLLLALAGVVRAESCAFGGLDADDPRCLFYSGTAAYRAQDYPAAARHWARLASRPAVPAEFRELQASAFNNLGFLYFTGKGVRANKERALVYWKHAARHGDAEATYHLCYAHAERNEPMYSPKRAPAWCHEALRRYEILAADPEEDVEDIVGQIEDYLAALEETQSGDAAAAAQEEEVVIDTEDDMD